MNPIINTPEIPQPGPSAGPVDAQVDAGGSELRPVAPTDSQVKLTSTQGLLQQAYAVFVAVLFAAASQPGSGQATAGSATTGTPPPQPLGTPTPPVPPGSPGPPDPAGPGPGASTADQLIWAVRMLVQLLLMYLDTPTNITLLKHPPNAGKLVPVIDDILKYAGAIAETDNRIFQKVNQQTLVSQRGTLVLLREVWKMFVVAANCVEAGISHVEQYLDANARFIYSKLVVDLAGDQLLQKDLQTLLDLIGSSIQAGLETKKKNQSASEASGEQTGPQEGGAQTGPGGGVNLYVNPQTPAPPASTGQPAAASSGKKQVAQGSATAAKSKKKTKSSTQSQGPKTKG